MTRANGQSGVQSLVTTSLANEAYQLNRRPRNLLGITARQLLTKTRIDAASALLRTTTLAVWRRRPTKRLLRPERLHPAVPPHHRADATAIPPTSPPGRSITDRLRTTGFEEQR